MIELEDPSAATVERKQRIQRALGWWGAVVLGAVMCGLMIGRLVNPLPAPGPMYLSWTVQEGVSDLRFELRAYQAQGYQRFTQAGAQGLWLKGVRLADGPHSGRWQHAGKPVSWRLENHPQGVQLLLVGLASELSVRVLPLSKTRGLEGMQVQVSFAQ